MTTFTQGTLRIVHTAAASADVELIVRISNRAASRHQLVDELLPELIRDAGIGRPPASTIDNDERVLRWTDGRCNVSIPMAIRAGAPLGRIRSAAIRRTLRKAMRVAHPAANCIPSAILDARGGKARYAQSSFYQMAAVALAVFAVWVAKPVLIPLALAVLLAFVLSPIVSWVQRRGLGRVAATLATVLVAFAAAASLAFVIITQIAALARELPQHQSEIAAKLERLRGSDGPFSRVARMVSRGTKPSSPPRIARGFSDDPARLLPDPKPWLSVLLSGERTHLIGCSDRVTTVR